MSETTVLTAILSALGGGGVLAASLAAVKDWRSESTTRLKTRSDLEAILDSRIEAKVAQLVAHNEQLSRENVALRAKVETLTRRFNVETRERQILSERVEELDALLRDRGIEPPPWAPRHRAPGPEDLEE